MFDPERGDIVHEVRFLHQFVDQLSTKARADWEAVDYVPTQVLTEFFLRVHDEDGPISGLIYNSVVTGRPAIVLDVPNSRCVAQDPGWQGDPSAQLRLGLVHDSVESSPVI